MPTGLAGVQAVLMCSGRSFGRHTHGEYGLGLLLQGGQVSHSHAGQVEALPGDCITVHPEEVHDGMPLGAQARRWMMLYFAPAFVEPVLPGFAFARPVLQDRGLGQALGGLFARLEQEKDAFLCEQDSYRVLALAAGRAVPPVDVPPSLRFARQLIEDDPGKSLMLGELAAAAGMNKFQLIRGFARAYQLTPHAFLMQRRLRLARQMLGAGLTPAQTAADAGFADQSHLTRLFVKCFGMTPAAYRRATRR